MENQVIETVLSTSCTCIEYDDITDQYYPADFCDGCYESTKFAIEALVFTWAERNEYTNDVVLVSSEACLWNNIKISRVIDSDRLVEFLSLNGEYTLYVQLDDKTLSVRRTSHDEPTGAYFSVSMVDDGTSTNN